MPQESYWLPNPHGTERTPLAEVWQAGDGSQGGMRRGSASLFPAGTGDCAAPKLLAAAAVQGLTPVSLAEVWFGAPMVERILPRRFRRYVEVARKEGRKVHAMTRIKPTRLEGGVYPCCDKCERILGWQLCSGVPKDNRLEQD